MCFVVHFHKKFWFWYQSGIVAEKVYATIWPILEISSLKTFHLSVVQSENYSSQNTFNCFKSVFFLRSEVFIFVIET